MEKLTKEIFHVNNTDKPKRSCPCPHSNSTENTTVDAAVTQVKKGLESQGLTGLEDEVLGTGNAQERVDFQVEKVRRRKPFRGQEIYLPVVRHKEGNEWIQL